MLRLATVNEGSVADPEEEADSSSMPSVTICPVMHRSAAVAAADEDKISANARAGIRAGQAIDTCPS
jgi:hypothetical protein